jgi:hypothetical protein
VAELLGDAEMIAKNGTLANDGKDCDGIPIVVWMKSPFAAYAYEGTSDEPWYSGFHQPWEFVAS